MMHVRKRTWSEVNNRYHRLHIMKVRTCLYYFVRTFEGNKQIKGRDGLVPIIIIPLYDWNNKIRTFLVIFSQSRVKTARQRERFWPRKIFSLPSWIDRDRHGIICFVCLDSAGLTRIFGMLSSSAFLGEQCSNFARWCIR